jgi:hypothetical protein
MNTLPTALYLIGWLRTYRFPGCRRPWRSGVIIREQFYSPGGTPMTIDLETILVVIILVTKRFITPTLSPTNIPPQPTQGLAGRVARISQWRVKRALVFPGRSSRLHPCLLAAPDPLNSQSRSGAPSGKSER